MKRPYLWGYTIGLLAALCIVLIWGWAQAAPLSQIFRSLVPEADNLYFVGTTSPSAIRWNSGHFGTGTSTAANGWNITEGCFAVNGSCLPTTGVSGSGVANRLAYFSGASALTSDANFVVDAGLGRLTATYASSTFITTTYASTTAVSFGDEIWITPLTSALLQTDSVGLLSEYAGTSCTNQFPRSLSALGAATCASVANTDLTNSTISGVALGGTLGALTATNGTLSFSGSYDGSTARTVGLALGSSNEWTASTTFSNVLNVEALMITASGTISTLNVNVGNIASSTHQTLNVNSCNGCAEFYSFTIASSSSLFGTRVDLPTKNYAFVVTRIACYVVGGTSKTITITDGTNAMDSIVCAGTLTTDDGAIANASVSINELMRITMGATSGAVDTVSVVISGTR